MPDLERLAGIVTGVLSSISTAHPADRNVLFGQLLLRLIEAGLYGAAPDDGSAFAASVNEQLSGLAAAYGTGVVWQLVRVRLPALDRPGATGGPRPLH